MDSKKTDWKLWAQIVLTVLTAIASALGITSCISKII
ncbi:MAG: smalltalk protein [Prevotellaceae bacterium]|nr:smalltalk protein [Candidatus Minthosoma caballi]